MTGYSIFKLRKGDNKPPHFYKEKMRGLSALDISADLIVYPDRATYTLEQEQFIRELLDCNEREQKIAITITRSLLRALRQDEPEKQD